MYAARDRLDETPDRQRAVRDRRYKYILNYNPGTPGAEHLAFRDTLDSMRELWALKEEGGLNAAQLRWFEPRPAEELYDTQADPYEIHNLADNPAYAGQLQRLRAAYEAWRQRAPDLGALPEEQMVRQFWPNLEQPLTAAPELSLDPQGRVVISSATEGASIGVRVGKGRWELYSGPFRVPPGEQVAARAVRYGWQESRETRLDIPLTN